MKSMKEKRRTSGFSFGKDITQLQIKPSKLSIYQSITVVCLSSPIEQFNFSLQRPSFYLDCLFSSRPGVRSRRRGNRKGQRSTGSRHRTRGRRKGCWGRSSRCSRGGPEGRNRKTPLRSRRRKDHHSRKDHHKGQGRKKAWVLRQRQQPSWRDGCQRASEC